MGSLYEAMKVHEQNEKDDTEMEEIGGFLSEEVIEEVMMKAGLIDDGNGFAGAKTELVVLESFLDDFPEIKYVSGDFGDAAAVAAASENLFASLISREGTEQWVTSASCCWSAALKEEEEEEEPMRGWIWYPYTDEELQLRSFEEDKVIWEYALWHWDDKDRVLAMHPHN